MGNLRGWLLSFPTAGSVNEGDGPTTFANWEALPRDMTLGSLGILWNLSNNSIYQEVLKDGSADSAETGTCSHSFLSPSETTLSTHFWDTSLGDS